MNNKMSIHSYLKKEEDWILKYKSLTERKEV